MERVNYTHIRSAILLIEQFGFLRLFGVKESCQWKPEESAELLVFDRYLRAEKPQQNSLRVHAITQTSRITRRIIEVKAIPSIFALCLSERKTGIKVCNCVGERETKAARNTPLSIGHWRKGCVSKTIRQRFAS